MFTSSRASTRQWSPHHGADRCPPPNPVSLQKPRMHLAVIFLLISCWVSLTTAISLDNSPRPTETTLLIDTRIPVYVNGRWQIMSDEEGRRLARREDGEDSGGITTTMEIDLSTVTAEASTTTAAATSPLPSPFDGALAANFSGDDQSACPNFINEFLSDPTFKSCYPISLLLQGSTSFFEAEKSLVTLTQVLGASCEASLDTCTSYFDQLATDLISDENCGTDYEQQNALVVQAYMGMRAYETIYRSTCLMDSDSAYCFANAVTNLTTASNAYLYYMPLNMSLPGNAVPTCDQCTSGTMAIYQSGTADRSSSIADTYLEAAQQINENCGAGFVNETLAAEVEGNAAASLHQTPSSLLLLSFFFMAISHWLF